MYGNAFAKALENEEIYQIEQYNKIKACYFKACNLLENVENLKKEVDMYIISRDISLHFKEVTK